MELSLATPNTVPARTYDRYGLLSLEMTVRPGGVLDVAAIGQQADTDGWSSDPATQVYLREPDLAAAIARSPDPATAAATMQSVTDGLLYMLGLLMADQMPGVVTFPPTQE